MGERPFAGQRQQAVARDHDDVDDEEDEKLLLREAQEMRQSDEQRRENERRDQLARRPKPRAAQARSFAPNRPFGMTIRTTSMSSSPTMLAMTPS